MVQILKKKKLPVILILIVTLLVSFVSVSTALDATVPTISTISPGNGVVLYTPNVNISFKVTDPDSKIQNGSYYIKVNGNIITSTLKYKGHSSGSQWVIDSYQEATITGAATGLKDGIQQVEVQAMDESGNITTKNWTFTIAVKPTFSSPDPARNSLSVNNTNFSIKVADNGQIDPASVRLALDVPVNYVNHTYNVTTGVISYTMPAAPLIDGLHTVYVSAKDMAGNAASYSWSYTVLSKPMLTFADAGKTYTNSAPLIKIAVKGSAALQGGSITVDGQTVPSEFTYKGYWYYPYDSDQPVWKVESYNEATITAQLNDVADGTHVVTATTQDNAGNSQSGQWDIIVKSIPVISAPTPANGTLTTENKGFSVKVTDNQPLNPTDIVVKMDGKSVPVNYNAETGMVTYQPSIVIPDGNHKVDVSVTDASASTASFSWSFTVQTVGPELTFANSGIIIDTYKPALTVSIKTYADINQNETIMFLDDQQVQAAFNYKGHWETPNYQDPVWVVSNSEATLTFTPTGLEDGVHKLSVVSRDSLNNTSEMSWQFTIDQKPLISGIEPGDSSTITSANPTIKAVINDPNGPEIDPSFVKLMIDNKVVAPTLTTADGALQLSYTADALTNDSYHQVTLSVNNSVGYGNSASWKFYINTMGEMPVKTQDCGTCHTLNQYAKYEHTSKGPYNFDKTTFFHGTGNNCKHCHTGYTQQFCGYCHNGDASDIALGTATPDPTIGAGKDCLSCHSPTPNVISTATASNEGVIHQINTDLTPPVLLGSNVITHDILPLHKVEKPSCNSCHSSYLTREHNRISKAGVQLDCSSCHNSNRPEVQQAIKNKNSDCAACHTDAGHQAQHASSIDANCQSCHSATLVDDHLNNPKTTGGKNYNCDTCHASTDTRVQTSITTNNKNCASCHSTGHNINFVESVPADIPLYNIFIWSQPLEAAIFSGEPSTPAGFESGKLVLSNRKLDVTAAQVWNFYQEQLSASGWMLVSGRPADGAVYFAATYQKNDRYLVVRCFNTETGTGVGQPASGYRVDIWYK